MAMLSNISHAGIEPALSLITTVAGAVSGKNVNAVNTTCSGLDIKRPMSQRGAIAGNTTIVAHWLLSLAEAPIAPRAARRMPYKRYPRMKYMMLKAIR